MAHTYAELRTKTVAELREIASGIENEAVKGFTQMNKEHLLVALCHALNLDTREHRIVKAVDKAVIKATVRQLKARRETFLEAHDTRQLKAIRHEIHELKRKLRREAEQS